jgi:uncharacterized protein
MSAASMKANEPSMEEILASIRRIIADDTSKKPELSPAAEPDLEQSADEADEADDVLDLATVPAASTTQAAFAQKSLADEIEFREIIVPDVEPAPEPKAEPPMEAAIEFEAVQEAVEPPPPHPASATQPTQPDRLLSAAANASVSQAFGALGNLMINQNAITLEDLVKDLMRPMLKSWLDDNLPALVERLVRAEIERVSRGPRA